MFTGWKEHPPVKSRSLEITSKINPLQQIENSLAHAVVETVVFADVTLILNYYRWLEVNEYVEYKLLPSHRHTTIISLLPQLCSVPFSNCSSSVVTSV